MRNRSRVSYEKITLKQRPDLRGEMERLSGGAWPAFLVHGDITHMERLYDDFAGYQIMLRDPGGRLIAIGQTVPFEWNGDPDDLPVRMAGIMDRAVKTYRARRTPNALSALAAVVAPDHQGRGLSAEILRSMRSLARENGLNYLVAPVRPTLKSAYPLAPLERYVKWEREDGLPLDPWLRVHRKLGAEFLRVMPESLVVTGSVPDWEEWTKMAFPESGRYVVPGALQPVSIDRERDVGRYEDPNVWMRHPVP
jgi:GNAT superfamily N-acetyltransferase